MKAILVLLLGSSLIQNPTGPYAEFYSMDKKLSLSDPLPSGVSSLSTKFFDASKKEIGCQIRLAEISLVRGTSTVKVITITDNNLLSLSELRSQMNPKDRFLIKIKEVINTETKRPIYLSKDTFSFTVQ
jgi:hypothetical protein